MFIYRYVYVYINIYICVCSRDPYSLLSFVAYLIFLICFLLYYALVCHQQVYWSGTCFFHIYICLYLFSAVAFFMYLSVLYCLLNTNKNKKTCSIMWRQKTLSPAKSLGRVAHTTKVPKISVFD